jgi:hypothetical protein
MVDVDDAVMRCFFKGEKSIDVDDVKYAFDVLRLLMCLVVFVLVLLVINVLV